MKTNYETLIEPVKNKRTFERVSDKLKELIFNGALSPGQRLPSEVELARFFRVGRQSVREGLRVLELSGLITVKSGTKGGAVIEGTMLTKLSGLFLETVKLNRMSLQDCIEAREAIETSVLSFVFRNAKQEDIQALRANVLQAKKKLLHSNDSAFQEHVDFHRLLAQASRNYALKVIVEVILVVFSDFTSGFRSPSIDEPGQIIDLHEGIVEALASKKEAKALELLKKELSLQESRLKAKTSRPVSTEI